LTAISSQMRRCSRGWCWAFATLDAGCSASACSSAGVDRWLVTSSGGTALADVVLGDEGFQHRCLGVGAARSSASSRHAQRRTVVHMAGK
jgi:hypothetical protein